MIIVTDRKLNIPRSEVSVGFTGDNLVEIRTFQLSRFYGNTDMADFSYKLDTQVGAVKNIIDLDKEVSTDTILLTWVIEESHVLISGNMAIQIRAFKGSVEKWHSNQGYVLVEASIAAIEAQPDPLPSEFEQMEVRITLAKNEAQEAEQVALGQANRAQGIADTFSNTTLPAAIEAVGVAGQAKVDLAEEQAIIATNKARDASDSAAAALSSEQNARSTVDEFLPIAIFQVEEAGQAKVDLAKAEADRAEDIIQEAEQDVLPELRQAIEDGIETKGQLGESIQEAGEAKTALDGSISSAGTVKGQLDDSIYLAGNAKTELDGSITTAGQTKETLDESIATGDLDSFKADYMQFKNDSTLESAKIEKELNDYKATLAGMNPNQEPKQKVNGYGIVSLPKNAANGQVSDVSVKGLTATNLVKNGNFANGTTGWNATNSVNTVSGNTLINTGNGGGSLPNASVTPFTTHTINTKYYVRGKIRVTNAVCQVIKMRAAAGYLDLIVNTPNQNQWYTVSGICDVGVTLSVALVNLSHQYADAATANGKVMEAQEVMVIDLTACLPADILALSNGNLKAWCDLNIPNWFDGTKSTVSASRLKSVGKNILNAKELLWNTDGYLDDNGELVLSGYTGHSTTQVRVKPSTTYTWTGIKRHGDEMDTARVYFYQDDYFISRGDIFDSVVTTVSSHSFTTPANCNNIRFQFSIRLMLNEFLNHQLEEGTTATEYEPYKESTVYINGAGELRSLPNGTKDEVNVSTGVRVQRIKKYILQASDVAFYTTSGDNVDIVGIKRPVDHSVYGVNSAIVGDTVLGNYTQVNTPDEDTAAYINCFTLRGISTYIKLFVAKGTYANVAAAQAALAGTTLTYQLATPIEIPIQTSGSLVSYPSGTVYIEPFVADAGIYTEKMEVLYSDLPIKELEKISKIDFDTGLETELDITAAVIAEDKLSFTHPDLTSGDIVFFVYEHGAEGTIPETEISYYDSRYVIKGEDDKFYQWEIEAKLVEGVITPSIKLVEV